MLDFIGQANKRYNFEDKFAALLSNTTRSVSREIKDGFISVPKGCYIQLEKKAAKYILENIRASYSNAAGLVSRVASFTEDSGLELTPWQTFWIITIWNPRCFINSLLFSKFAFVPMSFKISVNLWKKRLQGALSAAGRRGFPTVDLFLLDLLPPFWTMWTLQHWVSWNSGCSRCSM